MSRLASWEAKQHIFNKIGYHPHEGQLPFHKDEHKVKEITGGVRAGKSACTSREITGDYGHGDLYWLIGLDYEACREEFAYLLDDFMKLNLVKSVHFPASDQCRLEIEPDILIETKSAKYPEKIASKRCRGIVMCEAAQQSYDIFLRSIERVSELDGFVILGGTLEESQDWYADLFRDFQIPDNPYGGASFSLPSWTNSYVFADGRGDSKILRAEAALGHDRFMERYGGVPIKPKGLVLPEFKSIMHTGSFPVNYKEPVYIGVDPGYHPSAYAVVFVQFINDHIYVVDEIFEHYLTTRQVIQLVKKKPYYQNIEGGAIDIQSTARHANIAERPDYDVWRDDNEGIGIPLKTRQIKPVKLGANRLRDFMIPNPIEHTVQLHIDKKCRGLISEFGGCKAPLEGKGPWKKKMDSKGNVLSDDPQEKNCDASKALIYVVVSRYGLGTKPKKRSITVPALV